MHLLVYGDLHGSIAAMYRHALALQQSLGERLDALLQVGDFSAARVEPGRAGSDLSYSGIDEFLAFASGALPVPIPTLFIGGNHEAWGALAPAVDGGELAPGLHFLGRVGSRSVAGVRVAGLSGIHSPRNFARPLPPQPDASWRYYRQPELGSLLDQPAPDVLLLHDWPRPLAKLEIDEVAGAPGYFYGSAPTPTIELVERLQPRRVFMGHLHSSRIEARLGRSALVGLPRFDPGDPASWRYLALEGS